MSVQKGAPATTSGWKSPENGETLAAQPGANQFIQTGRRINVNNEAFQTYDLPGGAMGSLTTGTFSLEGYASGDLPVLYFSYYPQTQGGSSDNNSFDGFKVYVSADGASWQLAATNVDTEYDFIQGIPEQDLLENTNAWRQARVDLSSVAGESEVRVRFDFSTAADMHVGSDMGLGDQLASVAATEVVDGQFPASSVGVAGATTGTRPTIPGS